MHIYKFILLFLCAPVESTNHTWVDEQAIFANNELGMRHIDVYGFDYDYTLASYSNALHFLIYDLAVKELISTYGVRNNSDIKCTGLDLRGLQVVILAEAVK